MILRKIDNLIEKKKHLTNVFVTWKETETELDVEEKMKHLTNINVISKERETEPDVEEKMKQLTNVDMD